jgi:hypothetical protein
MDWAKFPRGAAIGFGIACLTAAAAASAPLSPGAHFRAVKVDVSPIADSVGPPTSTWLAQVLPGELQAAFADRLVPGDRSAPTLVVRIHSVYLGASGNGVVGPSGAVEAMDNIDGSAAVVGPNGGELAVYPLFVPLQNFTGGVNYETGTQQNRIGQLAHAFAYWLPSQMGL